jgi:hypothetical protein
VIRRAIKDRVGVIPLDLRIEKGEVELSSTSEALVAALDDLDMGSLGLGSRCTEAVPG